MEGTAMYKTTMIYIFILVTFHRHFSYRQFIRRTTSFWHYGYNGSWSQSTYLGVQKEYVTSRFYCKEFWLGFDPFIPHRTLVPVTLSPIPPYSLLWFGFLSWAGLEAFWNNTRHTVQVRPSINDSYRKNKSQKRCSFNSPLKHELIIMQS